MKYGTCEKYVIGKYQENWKHGQYEKYELGKYQENCKYGNLENRKWENIKKIGGIESLKNMELEIWKMWKMIITIKGCTMEQIGNESK